MSSRSARLAGLAAVLLVALGVSALVRTQHSDLRAGSGLLLEVVTADAGRSHMALGRVDAAELPSSRERALPRFRRHVRFRGYWVVEPAGRYEMRLLAEGEASLRIDGVPVVAREATSNSRSARATVELAEGPHSLEVEYKNETPPHQLLLRAGLKGEPLQLLDPLSLSIERPPVERVRAVEHLRRWTRAERLVWLAFLAAALAMLTVRRQGWLPWARRHAPLLHAAVAILIVAWAGALRFEALVVRYWQPSAPWWAVSLAERIEPISPRQGLPRWIEEQGYAGDPVNYIRFGREMQGFYDAHVREPLFVALTRAGLFLADDRDLGVSFASAFASTLLVGATYLLGRRLFSAPAGVLAAAALGVDRHVIELSGMGWRDDTFALFVVLSVYAWLRCYDRPSFANGLLAGLASGAAVLTRITALSFVVPVAAYAALLGSAETRRRLECCGVAVLVLGAVVAPYLVTCAIAFGDPLYSINYHMHYYGYGLEAGTWSPDQRWSDLVLSGGGLIATLRKTLIGLTSYPFTTKWQTFERWWPLATLGLQAAAVFGLLRLALSRRGALVVLALLGSLLPYAFTWDSPGGSAYRFTLHAYPFYLVAGFGMLGAAASWVWTRAVDWVRPAAR